jgi:hypothetical protein
MPAPAPRKLVPEDVFQRVLRARESGFTRRTVSQLKSRGVEFKGEPIERPYGVDALFKDDSGNWFSLTEPRGG